MPEPELDKEQLAADSIAAMLELQPPAVVAFTLTVIHDDGSSRVYSGAPRPGEIATIEITGCNTRSLT